MSEENSGAVQGALLPREGISPRSVAERPAVRLTQVGGGQYVLSSPAHGLPALAQISNSSMSPSSTSASQSGVARIINFSPARVHSTSVRPSVANQNIVNALTKPRSVNNVRNHLMPNTEVGFVQTSSTRSPMKRSLSPTQREKEIYGAKLQRVLNHRSVRSQILREKYNENLMERYFLETSDSILELPQFAKRQKTQHYLAYLNDNVIDSKYTADEDTTQVIEPKVEVPVTTSSSPTNQNLTESSINTTTIASSTPITTVPEFISTKSITSNTIVKTRLSSNFSSPSNQEQIVEKAKQEAYVVQRISDLQKEGLWSEKRLPKVQEMSRIKAHWDFLLEEMIWLAADFAQERKWKKAAAKKCARMVQKHFQDKALAAQKAEKAHEQHLRRVASFCAREIKSFWANVEKLVEYKQHTRLEEKRKQALDQQLSFIVDQTEKYSQLLAKGMNKSAITNSSILSDAPTPPSTRAPSRLNSDDEFKPDGESTDDEETIAQEEEAGTDQHHEEIAALQRESEMDLETFLSELPKDYLQNRDKIKLSDSEKEIEEGADSVSHNTTSRTDDEDFIASSDSEDDEDTIQEQEKVEGTGNHKEEIEDLKAENEMSVDELKKKYSNLPPLSSIEKSSDTSSGSDSSDKNDEDPESEEDALSNSDVDVDISEDETQTDDIGLKSLLEDSASSSQNEGEIKTDNQDLIDDAAAIAESIQPKGNTLSSTSVVTPIPFLLKYTLREYQHIGLDWLVTMFERKLNGILADEMGLGKTIQTIALMAHLASEKENWGPHLIIVPTSVMLNWEMECKKWCPAFKILTYYGTQKERKQKRTGWTKPNAFHICITSYKLVIQDHQSFRRKKWKYLILDEAQNIKNFKSQRWQLLLNFSTQQRLLLTGTPLQNNLMELWSLMHFLMPHVFQSHREFKEWFSNPVTGMIEGNSEYNESIIKRLHKVLRPFLLRRLKSEVEKQMPKKYEHVVMCRLSKRQRFLYDDYMSRAKTKETLATGNLLSVINVLMQLRKVCNHPNLFEVRPTISPFQCDGIRWHAPSIVYGILNYDVWRHIEMQSFNMNLVLMELSLSAYQCYRMRQYQTPCSTIEEIDSLPGIPPYCPPAKLTMRVQKSPVNNTRTMEVPKGVMEIKPGQTIPPNLKYKLASPGVFQLVQQPLKVENCGQNKIMFQSVAGQMFHTSTGKQIILAPSTPMSISSAIAIPGSTVVTTGGQRLTLFPKQSVSGGQIVTNLSKGLPKIQLMSVASQINTSTLAVQHVNEVKADDDRDTGRKTVGSKFIDKLYSSQSNNLDVRWKKQPSLHKQPVDAHLDDGEIVIKDHFKNKLELIARINERRCSGIPLYGKDFQDSIKIYKAAETPVWGGGRIHCLNALYNMNTNTSTDCLMDMLYTPEQRIEQFKDLFDRFIVYVPAVQAPQPELQVWHPEPSAYWGEKRNVDVLTKYFSKPATCLHSIASAMVTQFPDPRLLQYDCGKLQTMDRLLRKLKVDGHRVLIFTQMTKMLDVLEAFLNFHGHIYLRLDGSTKVDQRQVLMERFNGDSRIFVFILSTRSGGIGVNLTGADTVIFYDSDWNPTMDAQAQDRCHRIGQTRDVHIYRLVSERTIEENILKKANQKRLLGDLAIEGGNFTTAFFKTSTIHDLFDVETREEHAVTRLSAVVQASRDSEPQHDIEQPIPTNYTEEKSAVGILENALAACEDDQDVIAARTATAEAVADLAEFDENIPLDDQEKEKEPEVSKAEQELENLIKQLTPVERYAMNFIEATEAAWSAEQLAAAEREIDQQKLEWEQNRLAALHEEEEERRAHDLEDDLDILTYSREDATNQVSIKNRMLNKPGRKLLQSKVTNKNMNCSMRSKNKLANSIKLKNDNLRPQKRLQHNRNSRKDINKSQQPLQISDLTENTENSSRLEEDQALEETCDGSVSDDFRAMHTATSNHIDPNSPRTRSRGTVAINLWTLDVSPILPSIKRPKMSNHTKPSINPKTCTDNDSNVDVDYSIVEDVGKKECVKKIKKLQKSATTDDAKNHIDYDERKKFPSVHVIKSNISKTEFSSDVVFSENSVECAKDELLAKAILGANSKVCKVLVTDVLESSSFSPGNSKYACHVQDNSSLKAKGKTKQFNEKPVDNVDKNLEDAESIKNSIEENTKNETDHVISNRKTKTNKFNMRPLKVKPLTRRKVAAYSKPIANCTLDTWLLKSPSPKHAHSNISLTKSSAANCIENDAEVKNSSEIIITMPENVAIKTEISKVDSDSLTRTSDSTVSIIDNKITANKVKSV